MGSERTRDRQWRELVERISLVKQEN